VIINFPKVESPNIDAVNVLESVVCERPKVSADEEGTRWSLADMTAYLKNEISGLKHDLSMCGIDLGPSAYFSLYGAGVVYAQARKTELSAKDASYASIMKGNKAFSWGNFFFAYEREDSEWMLDLIRGILTKSNSLKELEGTWEGNLGKDRIKLIVKGNSWQLTLGDMEVKGTFIQARDANAFSCLKTHMGVSPDDAIFFITRNYLKKTLSREECRTVMDYVENNLDEVVLDDTRRLIAENVNFEKEREKLVDYLIKNNFFPVKNGIIWLPIPAKTIRPEAFHQKLWKCYQASSKLILVLAVHEDNGSICIFERGK
jgi:hypothetical protein